MVQSLLMEDLGKLFGSVTRVKIMRLFIFNPEEVFIAEEIAKRSRSRIQTVRKELRILESIGFIKKRSTTRQVQKKSKSKKKDEEAKYVKRKYTGWLLDEGNHLVQPLRNLLIDSELVPIAELPKRFRSAGQLKLLVLSGIFVKDSERKVDILVVADKLDRGKLGKVLSGIESEIGKELRYSIFTPDEFMYRLHMYDRLLLDIFENKHRRVVEKIKVPL